MKLWRIVITLLALGVLSAGVMPAAEANSERMRVPKVAYLTPDDETTVDLTGKQSLVFTWKQQPIASGGVAAYKFRVYKDFSYEVVFAADPGRGIFSVEVPADKFENGKTYSWHVQQRDAGNLIWSLYMTWSFKVKK